MKKDFINIQDFSAEELRNLRELSSVAKEAIKQRALPDLLHQRSIAMIFEEPTST